LDTWLHTFGLAHVAFAATSLSALVNAILVFRVCWKRKSEQTSQSDHAKHFTHHSTPINWARTDWAVDCRTYKGALGSISAHAVGNFSTCKSALITRIKIPEIVFLWPKSH